MPDGNDDRTHQLWTWAFEGNGEPPARQRIRDLDTTMDTLRDEVADMKVDLKADIKDVAATVSRWIKAEQDREIEHQKFLARWFVVGSTIIGIFVAVGQVVAALLS